MISRCVWAAREAGPRFIGLGVKCRRVQEENRGKAYYEKGDYQLSIRDFDEAIKLGDDEDRKYFYPERAKAQAKLKDALSEAPRHR